MAVFTPGETIAVTWRETINHPGHYRIAFDVDGQDGFVDPASAMELHSNDAVLLDGIADMNGGSYSATVTLPDVECETCTLQLIQVMYDKPPYGDGNDIYYQCADIALRRVEAGDGGVTETDAAAMSRDGGATPSSDGGGERPDAGTAPGSGGRDATGGCACAAGGIGPDPGRPARHLPAVAALLLLGARRWRRRRAGARVAGRRAPAGCRSRPAARWDRSGRR